MVFSRKILATDIGLGMIAAEKAIRFDKEPKKATVIMPEGQITNFRIFVSKVTLKVPQR